MTRKGAVTLLTKCAAIEFAALGYNIRVNSVHPGGIQADMLHSMMKRHVELGAVSSIAAAEGGIVAQPQELGGVVYLSSPPAASPAASS